LLFLILGLALAPLGIIGVYAAAQSMWKRDADASALLATSTRAQADALALMFARDTRQIETVLAAVTKDDLPAVCQALFAAYPGRSATGRAAASVQVVNARTGANLCVAGIAPLRSAIGRPVGTVRNALDSDSVVLTAATLGNDQNVELRLPLSEIQRRAAGTAGLIASERVLRSAFSSQHLDDITRVRATMVALEASAPVGTYGIALVASADRALFDGSEAAISIAVPVGMWLLAAVLSWLIVDTVLLTPVSRLSRRLAEYSPGDELPRDTVGRLAAREVAGLDDMTGALADRVRLEKAARDQSLDHQRALTREVHHRVKNNLQIIASLINLHSRTAQSADADQAFRTIHRRVEALAVVHRNLQVEGEGESDVPVANLLADLVNGLREGLGDTAGAIALVVDSRPAFVTQDTALPMAFFVTELIELALQHGGAERAELAFTTDGDDTAVARLSVTSAGLRENIDDAAAADIAKRVISGLARQLRQTLTIDETIGRYVLPVPLIVREAP
jgi:two-component system, sensor histidine kinase PdtaS